MPTETKKSAGATGREKGEIEKLQKKVRQLEEEQAELKRRFADFERYIKDRV